ncbi:hypothetical protein WJX75_003067 [Coccomyxa subellipsoidea]|uniref:Ribosomal RNA methyltransferase FtsJ domain-containing protein n=1 Tax=Coccomyxa subellipsoidea TaxID=248742 RepID=A0ABR2YHG7_9CHLO
MMLLTCLRGPHFVSVPPILLEQAHLNWLSCHAALPSPLWRDQTIRRTFNATCRVTGTTDAHLFGVTSTELDGDPQTSPTLSKGKVAINGRVITKAGTPVASTSTVDITAEAPKFVCRAGLKLEGALDHFGLDVSGMRVLDAGLSTGGFTDCLLQRGASHVIGVDVGYGQVAERVRTDPRVTVMERTNLRYVQLTDLPEQQPVDLATLDLSFISLLKVLPAVCAVLAPRASLLALIKPQFEAGRDEVGKGGIVRDASIHRRVIEKEGKVPLNS